MSIAVALAETLSKNIEKGTSLLLCTFGAGPDIACGLYRALGIEKSKVIDYPESSKSHRKLHAEVETTTTVSGADAKPFTILFEQDFERAESSGHKVLARDSDDARILSEILQNHAVLYTSDATANCLLTEPSIARHAGESVERNLEKIPVINQITLHSFLAFKRGDPTPEKIEHAYVHKRKAANVLISKAFRLGNLFHFNMFLDTEELRFDHESDHVQGMLAIEAMRQAGIATAHLLGLPLHGMIVLDKIETTFTSFLEAESPILIRTALVPGSRPKHGLTLVQVTQNNKICAVSRLSGTPYVVVASHLSLR